MILHGIPHMVSVTQDITARRKTLRDLKLSEKRYRSFLKT